MQLVINGTPRQLENISNIVEMLASLGLDARQVAVERNGTILSRSRHHSITLSEGDRIEIVQFIGGG